MKAPDHIVLAFLATIFATWAGLVLGVSFLSARAKFRAPSITIPVALDVGRQTFRMLSNTELLLAATASVACTVTPSMLMVTGVVLVWSLIATERLWLLPVLDWRAGIQMTGRVPDPSYHHGLFARLEMAKTMILLGCSGMAILNLTGR